MDAAVHCRCCFNRPETTYLEILGITQLFILLLPQILYLILVTFQLPQLVQHLGSIRILGKDLLCQSFELLVSDTHTRQL